MIGFAPVELDVFSDVVCPWCYIGKRRLEQVLAVQGGVEVRWRAYQLRPDLPAEGLEARVYYTARFGSEEKTRAIFDHVAEVGRQEGLTFDFPRIRRAPNTRLAHRAIKLLPAASHAAGAEALFRGHFQEGADIGRAEAIAELFAEHQVAGLERNELLDALASGAGQAEVQADLLAARDYGITGVPFFLANRRVAVVGAQPPEILTQLLVVARQQAMEEA
jgi:predicted DsbA family dithiol-disulfide isomerase